MLNQVREIFSQVVTNDDQKGNPSPKSIIMSAALYNHHLNLYRDIHIMLNQQDRVLGDGEHHQVIIEGLRQRMRMPRTELFKLRVAALRAHMNTYDPRKVVLRINDKVEVPLPVARAMNVTMLQATAYVFDYFSEMKATDYVKWLKWLKALKQKGFPYAGPGSLQETFNTYIDLHYLAAQLQDEVLPVPKVPNWTRMPVSPDNSRHIPDPGADIDVRKMFAPVDVKSMITPPKVE